MRQRCILSWPPKLHGLNKIFEIQSYIESSLISAPPPPYSTGGKVVINFFSTSCVVEFCFSCVTYLLSKVCNNLDVAKGCDFR